MSRKKKQYNIMRKDYSPEIREVWGCNDPGVIAGTTKCDGDCSTCKCKYVAETYKVYK